jgi:hypothetical protein
VPIRRPRDFTVILRAHADIEAVPFDVRLVVNSLPAGVQHVVAGWRDYAFPVSVRQLRPGFNLFELRFPGQGGSTRRVELAVHSLELTPRE